MKFTLSWLRDHLDTDATPERIADALTMSGLEVESLTPGARLPDGFETVRIATIDPHPDADGLRICRVESASGVSRVVCGAPNVRVGMRGVHARPGSVLPVDGRTIRMIAIRGVDSEGMLCSESELGLSNDAQGVVDVGDDVPPGASASDALGLSDPTFAVSVAPNRPDCLGVRGIARELAARGEGRLLPESEGVPPDACAAPREMTTDDRFCSDAAWCVVRGMSSSPGPAWMRNRLRAIGSPPAVGALAAARYVTVDRGRPVHAYDDGTLRGAAAVRAAIPGEMFDASDGAARVLTDADYVTADADGPLGMAGIADAAAHLPGPETRDAFLVAARFDPATVAESGRRHRLDGEMRRRFERGTDPVTVRRDVVAAARLVAATCGGAMSPVRVTGNGAHAPPRVVAFDTSLIRRTTGTATDDAVVETILRSLGFGLGREGLKTIVVPSWRDDVEGPVDVVDEIVRVRGCDHVRPVPLPRRREGVRPILPTARRRERAVRRTLAARGLIETLSPTLVGEDAARAFGAGADVALDNPLSSDMAYLRPRLLACLLAAGARNRDRGRPDVALFEIGPEFVAARPGAQRTAASGIRTGDPTRSWRESAHRADVWTVRADAEAALAACGARLADVRAASPGGKEWYHPGRSGVLACDDGPPLARFGEIHPSVLKVFGLSPPVLAFEVRPGAVPVMRSVTFRAALPPSDLPSVRRDFAFEVACDVPADMVVRAARSAAEADDLRVDVHVFDVFEGGDLPQGATSVAVEVVLHPTATTLTRERIEEVATRVVATVARCTQGRPRS